MVRSSLLAGLALGLAVALPPAAATVPPEPAVAQAPATTDADFRETALLLNQGFQAIHDRTIEERSIPELALAGLRGLSTIDASLAVTVEGDVARFTLNGETVLGAPLPETETAKVWGAMVAVAARELRHDSPALAAAPLEAIHTAIMNGALDGFDVHTRYDPPEEADKQRSKRNGFSGIGVRYVREGDAIRIREVLPEGPSDGLLREDDLVTHVDGLTLAGMEMADMSHHLRGPRNSTVALTVLRGEDPARDVTIVRDKVVPQSVTAEVRDGVAVVRIRRFNIATAASVREALEEMQGGAVMGAVLDLRSNPGGLLDQAYGVADLFIDDGVLVTTRGRHPGSLQSYSASAGDMLKGRPMVVLVDGRSASSAEILAAALKDTGRATLVGTNSYGKGTVQTIVRLPNRGELKLTWSRFHSPAGYAIQDLGVMPSLCLSGVAEEEAEAEGFVPASSVTAPVGVPVAEAVEERWETVLFDAKDERLTLRDTCLRETRGDVDADVEVAVEMIRSAAMRSQHATLGR